MRFLFAAVLPALLLLPTTASAVLVSVNSAYNRALAVDSGTGSDSDTTTTPSGTTSAAFNSTTSDGVHTFANASNQAFFNTSTDLSVGSGGYADYAYADGFWAFTLTETVDYVISGNLSGTGSGNDRFYIYGRLYDSNNSNNVFYEYDYADTGNGNVSLDGNAQGGFQYSTGSTTGTLGPGQYQFQYIMYVQEIDTPFSGVDGTGFAKLTLNSQVPEPSSLLMFAGLGLCFGGAAWRKRRMAAA